MKSQPISIEKQPTINHFGTKAGPNIRHHLLSPFLASVNLHRENREYSFSLSITYTSIVSIEYQRNSFNQVHSRKCTCKRKYTCSEHIHIFSYCKTSNNCISSTRRAIGFLKTSGTGCVKFLPS
uniref:Uncharacterized protein n=1 Tax=Cacopsylla melanoneura TaxID=428564 RepID=A0A8D8UMD8_9HEMI